jgi:hypothetical protein
MPSGFGVSEGFGASGACCCEAFAGPSVKAPGELVQVPAKKLAAAIVAKAKTAATARLRSRRLAPTLVKKLIVRSSQSERRKARQATTSHIISIVRLCLLPMYIDSKPVGGVGHVRITCDFGAGPMSIRACPVDHGYDSHYMFGRPAFWSCKTLCPRNSETSHTSRLARSFGSAALAHTVPQVGHSWLPQSSCCYRLPARTTIRVRTQ